MLGGYSAPVLETDRPTLGTLLQAGGYRTAAVGKWHLGMEMPYLDPEAVPSNAWQGDPGIDFAGTIADSPIHHGFEEYFGISASLDMAPYVYIRNDRFTALPTHEQPAVPFPHFIRPGPRADDFVIDEVLDRLVEEAVGFIDRSSRSTDPFFLYLPLTAPHKPAQPHSRFRGRTGLGEYGDFVAQVDDAVGQVLAAVDRVGASDDTLVIFTSDNGSYMYRHGDGEPDHVDDSFIQAYRVGRHRSNASWRGTKADIWEGGHRVPFVVRWPGVVEPGSETAATVVHTDLYATLADVVVATPGPGAAEDSVSLLPMLRGEPVTRGVPVVHQSYGGMLAVRDGQWKLVLGNGSGGRQRPLGYRFRRPYQLFDLSQDPTESQDLAADYPQVVERLEATFERFRLTSRSVPLVGADAVVTPPADPNSNPATQSDRAPAPEEDVDVDYDADDDGLIEIATLAQLDAVRHDLDGDGVPVGSGTAAASGAAARAAAFPDAAERMGCPAPACVGYELVADLDFDTDGSGAADAGDAFWNGGAGWRPIGTLDEPFTAVFSGNGRDGVAPVRRGRGQRRAVRHVERRHPGRRDGGGRRDGEPVRGHFVGPERRPGGEELRDGRGVAGLQRRSAGAGCDAVAGGAPAGAAVAYRRAAAAGGAAGVRVDGRAGRAGGDAGPCGAPDGAGGGAGRGVRGGGAAGARLHGRGGDGGGDGHAGRATAGAASGGRDPGRRAGPHRTMRQLVADPRLAVAAVEVTAPQPGHGVCAHLDRSDRLTP